MVGASVVIELSMTPEIAATTPAIPITWAKTRPTLTPMSCAASRFSAVARMARPMRVRESSAATSSMVTTARTRITTFWKRMKTPETKKPSSMEKGWRNG